MSIYDEQVCANCRFSNVVWVHQSSFIECRRHAPTVVPKDKGEIFGNGYAFPKAPGFCGDFEPMERPEAASSSLKSGADFQNIQTKQVMRPPCPRCNSTNVVSSTEVFFTNKEMRWMCKNCRCLFNQLCDNFVPRSPDFHNICANCGHGISHHIKNPKGDPHLYAEEQP